MKAVTPDNKDGWTSCELRRLLKTMENRFEQQLQLDYFDEEITEHLNEPIADILPASKQK